MPLIQKPATTDSKKQIRIRLTQTLKEEAEVYCQWAELPNLDYLIEQALVLTLKKDKEWKLTQEKQRPKKR